MHQKEISEVFRILGSSEKGLSSSRAEQKLHDSGLNELKVEEGIHPLKIIQSQFSSSLVWILMVALIISFLLKEYVDSFIIAVIIVANALLGFIQEYRAEKAIEALKKMASPKANVIRDGKEVKIESCHIVPGDVIILETGDKVPADARLFEIHNMETQEAHLTGESQPVTKTLKLMAEKTSLADRKNMIYSSIIISNGRGKAVVTATGMNTEVGKIASLIKESQEELTPLQKKLRLLGKRLTVAVVIVAFIVFLSGLISGKSASMMFLTAIALAVAAIPEGLPAVITISLAIGVRQMARKNALIRKLPSVETLGCVSVICSDKTGTLTHNEMTVTKAWANNTVYDITGSGYSSEGEIWKEKNGKEKKREKVDSHELQQLLSIGLGCNDAKFSTVKGKREVIGDPTEAALIVSAEKTGLTAKRFNDSYKRIEEIPFTSERKMMTTIHQAGKKRISYTKGAPDVILEQCDRILINGKVQRLGRAEKKEILKKDEEFASAALRVLGFSYNEDKKGEEAEKGMIFVGLQAMIDPPREEVKDSILRCQRAGIRVIMVTGDQIATAQAIAQELNIKGDAVTGQELEKIKDLKKNIKSIAVFARLNPEHKLMIVKALKESGFVVAMTGDGINDAPALKKADIGISMGITGTDVAKEASDMILTDDNFTSIVNAVEEGRGIFDNIRKFVNYLLSSNLGEISVILFASLFGFPLPLTAIQILWVNLVTDGLPATALALDPYSPGIMERKPRAARESILSSELRGDIIIFGILIGAMSLVLFWLYQKSGLMKAQTIVFTSLVLFELVRLQTIRSDYQLKIFSNKWLVGAVILSVLLHLLVIYTPFNILFKTTHLEPLDWGVLVVASALLFIIYKSIKWLLVKKDTEIDRKVQK